VSATGRGLGGAMILALSYAPVGWGEMPRSELEGWSYGSLSAQPASSTPGRRRSNVRSRARLSALCVVLSRMSGRQLRRW